MATIGEELKRERNRRGLTIKDVERVLHIRAAYLEALEEDNYKLIPGDVYVKGFIGNYADFLGLERHRFIDRYKSIIGEPLGVPLRKIKPRRVQAHEEVERQVEVVPPRAKRLSYTSRQQRRKKTLAQERLAVTIILICIVIFLIWLFFM
ncbi:RodZ family helix-turn-helix domain-containing protein [uncultured Veillonella sp.]|uniref:helix-turn-helix domain-containing protein n=1 Tax=uncultured Veillonella sp. TaxID=159268 RepID=UPI0025F5D982|nr:helix-turn-helix domain-containing protein [uncultured Veillonella sp.]MDY3973135.1 helix-turn-helix domain-containing protein [Veillonella caviae]